MTPATLLHRQINPHWVQEGRVTSQAFKPTPKDQNLLSVYDGDLMTAEAAWEHFTGRGLRSVGCLAVTEQECREQGVPARSDPTPFPAHAVIDFTTCESQRAIERTAKRLTVHAVQRAWQHRAE
jgi:hypothetical protein